MGILEIQVVLKKLDVAQAADLRRALICAELLLQHCHGFAVNTIHITSVSSISGSQISITSQQRLQINKEQLSCFYRGTSIQKAPATK